jgi:hypothetical protein
MNRGQLLRTQIRRLRARDGFIQRGNLFWRAAPGALQLIEISLSNHSLRGPCKLLLVLHVQRVPLHQVGRIDFILRAKLAGD